MEAADEAGERLAVTTPLAGDEAGQKTYAPGEGHSSAGRADEATSSSTTPRRRSF